jgi:precorrin-6B C5,15-methyltransferase / cobalt-precorrin-6B C5,C15-methyltransferase
MQVRLIGIGCKADRQLTIEALEALKKAELIVGAKRMLEALPEEYQAEKKASYLPQEILQILQESEAEKACVLYSGDSGFYSGARSLLPLLEENGIEAEVLPGISSLQTLAAKTGKDWQDWKLCSAHGVDCDILSSVMEGRACLFLTGGTSSPQSICRELTEAGLGELSVIAGEKLSYPEERIVRGKAKDIAEMEFDTLSLLLTEAAPVYPKTVPGIPDEAFIRDKVPMTKREVRAAILASLAIGPKDICWDIGAGTGSVSIEMALHSSRTYAIEQKEEALALIHKNREKFCAWNLKVLRAKAPEGLEKLPKPDAVFVGGSGGNMAEIIGFVHEKNPQARICISAIALESLQAAMENLEKYGYEIEISQILVSRSKAVAGLHMLMAQNPIFLIKGEKK